MKSILVLLLSVLFFSCQESSQKSYDNNLLTGITWGPSQKVLFNGEMSNYNYPIHFYSDGRYELGEKGMSMIGKWSWLDSDEILLSYTGLTAEKEMIDFPSPTNYHIKIISLDKNEFHFLEKEETKTWDSKEVREEVYLANN